MTGYFAEKADKQIIAISHEILNNKDVVKQVRNRHPELYQKINNFYQKHKEKQLNQER